MRNADQLIGARIEGGVVVNAKGNAKAVMTGAVVAELAGSAGKMAAEMAAERAGRGSSPLGTLSGKLGYLAITETELVLLNGRTGLTTPKATGVAARVPRERVESASLGEGKLAVPLDVTFEDGGRWQFEVGRAYTKNARSVIELLQRP